MKTTIELPDELLRRAKLAAAARGWTFKELLARALRDHLNGPGVGREGWRAVFGQAERRQVDEVDAAVAADLERIDPATWT